MGWVGHDLKTGEIICFGRWLVDFNFWVGLRWLGASQMYVGWCVLRWSGLDWVLFRIGPFIEQGSDWDKAFGKLAWDSTRSGLKRTRSILQRAQQINQQHILISFSQSHTLSLNLQELTFTVEIPEISPSSLMILDTSWRKVSKYL